MTDIMDKDNALEMFKPVYERIYGEEYEDENNASLSYIEKIISLIMKGKLEISFDENNDYVFILKLMSSVKLTNVVKEELKLFEPTADDLAKIKSLKERENMQAFEFGIELIKACSSKADAYIIGKLKASDFQPAYLVCMFLCALLGKDSRQNPSIL